MSTKRKWNFPNGSVEERAFLIIQSHMALSTTSKQEKNNS
jgi:hypothetical protein